MKPRRDQRSPAAVFADTYSEASGMGLAEIHRRATDLDERIDAAETPAPELEAERLAYEVAEVARVQEFTGDEEEAEEAPKPTLM